MTHHNSQEQDIRDALHTVTEGKKGVCPLKASACHLLGNIKAHPWWTMGLFAAAIACSEWMCVYTGVLMLGGAMIWAMKNEAAAKNKAG